MALKIWKLIAAFSFKITHCANKRLLVDKFPAINGLMEFCRVVDSFTWYHKVLSEKNRTQISVFKFGEKIQKL